MFEFVQKLRWRSRFFLLLVLLPGGASTAALHRNPQASNATSKDSIPTEIRVESVPWWPTTGSTRRSDYVGSKPCAQCHQKEYVSQQSTSMARAAFRAADSRQLRDHPQINAKLGSYSYQLSTKTNSASFSVTDGTQTTTKNLLWAVGDGRFGQTYLYRDGDQFYESQLSFYTRENSLAMTTGHMQPSNLATAAGIKTTPTLIHQCFGCHFTASTTSGQFKPDDAEPGVMCEACHGPGLSHVGLNMTQATESADSDELIMNPAKLSPSDSVDFCGACHRTSIDAALQGLTHSGVASVRLQPYRLQKSKCWGKGDARITCIACHDPHVQLVTDPHAYDDKCLECHASRPHKAGGEHLTKACPVGTHNCVSCHMAKIDVPGTYTTFTDHWIRVVKPGAPYPE